MQVGCFSKDTLKKNKKPNHYASRGLLFSHNFDKKHKFRNVEILFKKRQIHLDTATWSSCKATTHACKHVRVRGSYLLILDQS